MAKWFTSIIGTMLCSAVIAGTLDSKYAFKIPAQPVSSALMTFSEQVNLQVMTASADLVNVRSPGVNGEKTVREALDALLSGTGLSFHVVAENAVAIEPGPEKMRVSREGDGNSVATLAQFEADGAISATAGQDGTNRASAPAEDSKLDEIVVTAQRRTQHLVDVPISIAVLGGRDLDKTSDRGVIDALQKVPGVAAFEGFQTGGASIAVRGVTAAGNVSVGASPIGYYIDMAPFGLVRSAVAPDVNAYDLERVEVLRGPQGTLFGSGSQNGTVRILTHQAELDDFSAKARSAISTTEGGGFGYRADAAVNIPLISDALAVRLVGGYQEVAGWIDKPNDEDANDGSLLNLRLRADARPAPDLSLSSIVWLSRSDFGAGSGGSANETNRSPTPDPIDTDFELYGFRAVYDFDALTITSSTSYLDYGVDSFLEGNFTAPGTNVLSTNLDATVFTQEVILNSRRAGVLNWTVGAMYRDATDDIFQYRRNILTSAPVAPYVQPGIARNMSESYSAFGELTGKFADGFLELTGGLRYFHDEVGVKELQRLSGTTAPPLVNVSETFEKVSPRAVIALHPSKRSTVYASYSEGFRSGFQQQPSLLVFDQSYPPVSPDNIRNYELGAKADLLDGLISVEASLYQLEWTDVQLSVSVLVGASILPASLNAGSASGPGFDAGLTLHVSEDFTIGASFSANDLKIDSNVLNQNGTIAFFEGNRLPLSPKYTAGTDLNYAFPLGGFKAEFSYGANYSSSRSSFFNAGGASVENRGDDFLIMNTRFSLGTSMGWRTALFVDNLTDERGYVQAPLAPTLTEYSSRTRPRTIGLQFDFSF